MEKGDVRIFESGIRKWGRPHFRVGHSMRDGIFHHGGKNRNVEEFGNRGFGNAEMRNRGVRRLIHGRSRSSTPQILKIIYNIYDHWGEKI